MRNAVYCCVSENYKDVVLPLLFSIKDYFSGDIFVGCVGGVDLKGVDFVTKIDIDMETLRLPNETDYPDEAMWSMGSRFFVHDYLRAEGYEKILYIDCDTVVINDLNHMFEIDIPEGTLGAVCEYNERISIEKYREFDEREFVRRLDLRKGLVNYFNSGVILFNKTPDLFEDYCNKVKADPFKFRFPDQDYLNERFISFVELPRSYNFFAELYAYKHMSLPDLYEAKKRGYTATILHYHCFCKPWGTIFSNPENVISLQLPVLPYYERALSIPVALNKDMTDTYTENMAAQDTELERLLRQDALLEVM